MKILYLNDYDHAAGGAELLTLRIRDGMRRRRHDARILATSAGTSAGLADYHCFGSTSALRPVIQTFNPFAAATLARVLKNFAPDVVHVSIFLTQLSPLILPLLRKVPCVYHAHWYRAVCPTGSKLLPSGKKCVEPWGRACLKHRCLSTPDWAVLMLQMKLVGRWFDAFDVVLPNSEAVKLELENASIRCEDVIPLGVERLDVAKMQADPVLIGFAGRLVREKGVDVLIRAFARVKEQVPLSRLFIAGDGIEREAMVSLVRALGVENSVEFAGHLPRPELERRMSAVAVQVVCSRWAEPFGLVAAEAMLRGTPVIASDIGGLREIVEHDKTGLLVRPDDVDALSGALIDLFSNPARARALGEAGRIVAESRFDENLMLDRMESLYASLIETKRLPESMTGVARRAEAV